MNEVEQPSGFVFLCFQAVLLETLFIKKKYYIYIVDGF